MTTKSRAAFVIMAGGRGERLWPLVRSSVPKVCVLVDGTRTLLEMTLRRIQPLAAGCPLLIVTTRSQARPIRKVLSPAFQPSVLAEPQPRNTAACIALSAVVLARRDPNLVMVVLPADHWIKQPHAFHRSLQAAIALAQTRAWMVTIGVRPTRVHPGLGHLCTGASLGRRHGCRVFRLSRFVEKPSRQIAHRLLREQRIYWNAGIFVGRVSTFLDLIQRWLPNHARRLFPLGKTSRGPAFARTAAAAAAYRRLRAVSFDDGVMAHLQDGCVVEGNFDWEDLGSWDSWARIKPLNHPGVAVASRNVRVISPDEHLVATIGLEDVVVVHTRDATLLCRTQDAQGVRAVVAQLSHDRRLSRYL